MDKNAIKKYAVWARRELISRVGAKAQQFGITEKAIVDATADSVNDHLLSADEKKQRQALIAQIKQKGFEQVMEEVAYTWFNRFSALRFMEVNGYLPSRIRVFTDEDGAFKPQILAEAIHLELDGLDMKKVYACKEASNNDELYKYLLITQCNALSSILPGMFQRIADYTELLFPDNLLRSGSVLEQMIALIPEEDWQDQVQIIGWLYQYYNSEPKNKVFADLKKNIKITKENIPAATQLFTPDWIVRYMVENSLGRLWVEGHPNDSLKASWKYYLDEAEQEPAVQAQLNKIREEYKALKPEDLKVIDPCMGSGHILAYMFDVLMQIYEAYGYTGRDAVRSIIENNLYGLDIDDRAAQLAYFSVMMKARQYDSRLFTRKYDGGKPDIPQTRVYAIVESNGIDPNAVNYFVGGDPKLKKDMDSLLAEMHDAKEYGSILNITPVDFDAIYDRFDALFDEISLFNQTIFDELLPLVRMAQALAQKYSVVCTNPPYMGNKGMGSILLQYIQKLYPDSKADLFAVFLEKCKDLLQINGFQAMITQHAWMFLSSYERLRMKISAIDIINMAHLGPRAFEEIGGEVVQTTSFVFRLSHIRYYRGTYCRLVNATSQGEKEALFLSKNMRFYVPQDEFASISGVPVAYWASPRALQNFHDAKPLIDFSRPRVGQNTGDNERFLRFWHEVCINKIGFSTKHDALSTCVFKWIPYNKGGSFRRWYGNFDRVVNWENNGQEIKDYAVTRNHGKHWSRYIQNIENMCRAGISWSDIASTRFACRYLPEGFICDVKGSSTYPLEKYRKYIMAYLNSCVAIFYLQMLNPTTTFQVGNIGSLPFLYSNEEEINAIAETNVEISRYDWDADEASWDFKRHPLLIYGYQNDYGLVNGRNAGITPALLWDDELQIFETSKGEAKNPQRCLIENCYHAWETICTRRFAQLKANEEELNHIFIDIYGLQDELTPEVEDKDVTVRLADLKRDIRSLISYAVGCMFGRYSLDVEGLAYAGGEWDASKYPTYPADKDNILPICDDEYFDDDITGRFVKFIETVYGKETLGENLRFIADALGGSGQPKEVLRNYFLNDFYADHLKIYQKRPIYWLFDSGKKNGFKALIYMHRYAPDTIARMRTDYVHAQQARYHTALADLERRISGASGSERVRLSKQLTKLQEQIAETRIFEEKIHHLADQMIRIDLDDGVKHNYEIFGDVLAKI